MPPPRRLPAGDIYVDSPFAKYGTPAHTGRAASFALTVSDRVGFVCGARCAALGSSSSSAPSRAECENTSTSAASASRFTGRSRVRFGVRAGVGVGVGA